MGARISSRRRRIVRLKRKRRSQTRYAGGRGILTRPLAGAPVVEPVTAVVVREQAALDHVLLVDGVTEHGRADRTHGGRGVHAERELRPARVVRQVQGTDQDRGHGARQAGDPGGRPRGFFRLDPPCHLTVAGARACPSPFRTSNVPAFGTELAPRSPADRPIGRRDDKNVIGRGSVDRRPPGTCARTRRRRSRLHRRRIGHAVGSADLLGNRLAITCPGPPKRCNGILKTNPFPVNSGEIGYFARILFPCFPCFQARRFPVRTGSFVRLWAPLRPRTQRTLFSEHGKRLI